MAHKSTEERRAQITRAMLHVMARQGYARATINRIADEAELTPGLIHYHFKGKRAILLGTLELLATRQLQALEHTIAEAKNPVDALDRALKLFLERGASEDRDAVAAWLAIGAEAMREPEVADAYRQALTELAKPLSEVIEEGVSQKIFALTSPLTPAGAAAAIVAQVQGYFALAHAAPEIVPEGSALHAARCMLSGLLTPQPT